MSEPNVPSPPTYQPTYNIYHCFLRDPSGYLLEIQTFQDPTWLRAGSAKTRHVFL